MKKKTYLYIHIPFCVHRCEYCSFYSVADLSLKRRYLQALKCDLSALAKRYPNHVLSTLYLGGGSPAVLSLEELSELLNHLRIEFDFRPEEFTIELNPHQLGLRYAEGLKRLGVTRLSLGVQSFDQGTLDALGRKAKAKKSEEAFAMLRDCGFDNISLDLIYGAPNSTVDGLKRDLDQILALAPEHVSTYCLSLDPGCELEKKLRRAQIRLPDEDIVASQLETVIGMLEGGGYLRYEISNFAKEGFFSKHNLSYWHYEDGLAAGASAVYTYGAVRVENDSEILRYMEAAEAGRFPLGAETFLSPEDQMLEALIMGLRLREGVRISVLSERFSIHIKSVYEAWLRRYTELGFLYFDGEILRFTDAGINVSNAILAELF